MKILITGATGFIGRKLVKRLKSKHELYIVSRNLKKAEDEFPFAKVVSINEISHLKLDGIIHLQGMPILSTWTKKNKKIIYDSRIEPLKKFQKLKLKFLISASAQAIYENDKYKVRNENERIGKRNDFLSNLTYDWEKYANRAKCRVVNLRLSMVLGKIGFLSKLIPQFKLGLGGYLGDKDSGVSWIHIDDLISIIEWSIENEINGPINCAANYTTNYEFMHTIGKVLNKPVWLHIPGFLVKLIGEKSKLFLSSIKMKSRYKNYKYTNLKKALKSIINE